MINIELAVHLSLRWDKVNVCGTTSSDSHRHHDSLRVLLFTELSPTFMWLVSSELIEDLPLTIAISKVKPGLVNRHYPLPSVVIDKLQESRTLGHTLILHFLRQVVGPALFS